MPSTNPVPTRERLIVALDVPDAESARELGEVGKRFIERSHPSLEAQLVDVANAIAYNNHDVDDGLRSGLISVEQLQQTSLFREHSETVLKAYPDIALRRLIHETVRRMMN